MATTILAATTTSREEGVFPGTFVQVLGMLLANRRTGLLVLTRPAQTSKVRFVAGQIVSASAGSPSNLLGEILIRCGLLGPSEVGEALHQARAQGRRLGAVLVERRLLQRDHIEEGLRLQVRDVLFEALYWPSGSWRFEADEGVCELAEEVTLRLSTAELILQLVSCIESAEAVRHALGDQGCPLAPAADSGVDAAHALLSSADAYVLSRVDGILTPRDIVDIAPLPAAVVERSLLGLLCAGMVAWKPRPLPRPHQQEAAPPPQGSNLDPDLAKVLAALAHQNHFEAIGVDRSATLDDVKLAYEGLVKRFHPDAWSRHGRDASEAARTIFSRVAEAYEVLRSRDSRARYEATLGPFPALPTQVVRSAVEAEKPMVTPAEAMAQVEALLAEGRRFEAVTSLEKVIPHLEGRMRQRARVLLARTYLGTPSGWRLAETELKEILLQAPGCLEALLLLGALYKDLGMNRRAAGAFRRALDVAPGHVEADRQLRSVALGADDTRPMIFARSA